MERYLITGASGFLGSALSKELLKSGHSVVPLKHELLQDLPKLIKFVEAVNPTKVVHLAAYGNMHYQQNTGEMIQANVIGTLNLHYALVDIPYKSFLNVSSSSVGLPIETNYSRTKQIGEIIGRMFDKPIVSARPFSVYGPGDNPKHFVPVAIKAFRENSELVLSHGNHDWIYIEDLVSGLRIIEDNIDFLAGKTIDVGTGLQTSNHTIISILRDIFDKRGRVNNVKQLRSYDNDRWVANPAVLRGLGWSAKTSVQEGLEKTVYGNTK